MLNCFERISPRVARVSKIRFQRLFSWFWAESWSGTYSIGFGSRRPRICRVLAPVAWQSASCPNAYFGTLSETNSFQVCPSNCGFLKKRPQQLVYSDNKNKSYNKSCERVQDEDHMDHPVRCCSNKKKHEKHPRPRPGSFSTVLRNSCGKSDEIAARSWLWGSRGLGTGNY